MERPDITGCPYHATFDMLALATTPRQNSFPASKINLQPFLQITYRSVKVRHYNCIVVFR